MKFRLTKIILQPKIGEETHLSEIFYDTLIFQQSGIISAAMLEGILLASNMAAKTTFLLISC